MADIKIENIIEQSFWGRVLRNADLFLNRGKKSERVCDYRDIKRRRRACRHLDRGDCRLPTWCIHCLISAEYVYGKSIANVEVSARCVV